MSSETMKIEAGVCYFEIIIEKNNELSNYSKCDNCNSSLKEYVYLVPHMYKNICKKCLDEILNNSKKSKVS